jgi:hypothetical protein
MSYNFTGLMRVQAEVEMMDYGTVGGAAFGKSLRGMGLNLLVRDVGVQVFF